MCLQHSDAFQVNETEKWDRSRKHHYLTGVVNDPVVGYVAGEVGEERRRGVLAIVCRSGDSVSSSHWKMREVMDAQISI